MASKDIAERDPEYYSDEDDEDDFGDDDAWEECYDDEESEITCLFCSQNHNTADILFEHCKKSHGFDIWKILKGGVEFIEYIMMINYIRANKCTPEQALDSLKLPCASRPWIDDKWMKPVNYEDALLQFDVDSAIEEATEKLDAVCTESSQNQNEPDETSLLLQRLQMAEAKNAVLESHLQQALEDLDKMRSMAKDVLMSSPAISMETSTSHSAVHNLKDDEDNAYFTSYGHFSIHAEMLKDTVRTESYMNCILNNPDVFKDKVVLDIGCGTGILSMFAAKAGARQVIGIDHSEIIYQAIDIVRENGLADVVKLIKGRVEDVEIPVEKVDIIISEWMGYFLLFESMLDTVLYARDKWLAPGGVVYPDNCTISLTASSDPELHSKHIAFWEDVYGFKMTCMKREVFKEASVDVVKKDKIITDDCVIKEINVCSCAVKDVDFISPFSLTCKEDGEITALIGYFDIYFDKLCEQKVHFSTGPRHTPTHWKQTVFLLAKPMNVSKGQKLTGELSCKKNRKDPRSLVLTIKIDGKSTSYLMQ